MRLLDLDPRLLRVTAPGHYEQVETLEQADGLQFLCPVCFEHNGGSTGTHYVVCWSPRVPLTEPPGPGRWELVGTGLHDLTLRAGSSSIQLRGGCYWHGYVRAGEVLDA